MNGLKDMKLVWVVVLRYAIESFLDRGLNDALVISSFDSHLFILSAALQDTVDPACLLGIFLVGI